MTNKETLKQNTGKYLVLVGIILTSLNLRAAISSISDIFSLISSDIPHFSISVMGVLPLICFSVFGAIAPLAQRKLGFEKSLFVSMLCVGIGIVLRATCSNFYVFVINSIIALMGIGFANVLLPPLFKKYFPKNPGPINSLYSVLIAVSAGLPAIVSADIVGKVGWRIEVGIWGLIGFAAAIPWILQFLYRPELAKPEPSTESEKIKPVYKWKQAWALAILFGLGGMLPMYTIINWLPTYLESRGMSMKEASFALFLYNTLGIVHSFVVPLILGKMRRPFLLIILAFILQVVGYLGFMFDIEHIYMGSYCGTRIINYTSSIYVV